MKYCKYCGTQLDDNAKFCTSCGGKVEETFVADANVSPYVECKLCGAKVERTERNCPVCGSLIDANATTYVRNPSANKKSGKNGLATAGFVVSLVVMIIGSGYFGMLGGAVGFILSIVGLTQINKGNGSNKGMAIAGIVIGIYTVVACILYEFFLKEVMDQILSDFEKELGNGLLMFNLKCLVKLLFIK